MSLLTSPHTHKQHLIFLNQLQNTRNRNQNINTASKSQRNHHYKSQRKSNHGYSNSYHIANNNNNNNNINLTLNPKAQTQRLQFNHKNNNNINNINKISTKVPLEANQKIQTFIKKFSQDIQTVVKQYPNLIDYYHCLSIMRNSQFFSDIANFFNTDLLRKKYQLEKALSQSKTMSQYWQKEYKKISQKIQRQNQNKSKLSHSHSRGWRQPDVIDQQQTLQNKYISSGTMSMGRKIYYKAKILSQDQFIQFYDSIALSNKIQIKNVMGNQSIRAALSKQKDISGKNKIQNSANEEFNEKLDKLFKLSENSKDDQKKNQINRILKQLAQIVKNSITESHFCKQPCCRNQQQLIDLRPNKAKDLIKTFQSNIRNRNQVYKSDKSQEYFQRYYRDNKNFNVNQVTSVQRTKLIQMEGLQQQYWKNYDRRIKSKGLSKRYGDRYYMGSTSYDQLS